MASLAQPPMTEDPFLFTFDDGADVFDMFTEFSDDGSLTDLPKLSDDADSHTSFEEVVLGTPGDADNTASRTPTPVGSPIRLLFKDISPPTVRKSTVPFRKPMLETTTSGSAHDQALLGLDYNKTVPNPLAPPALATAVSSARAASGRLRVAPKRVEPAAESEGSVGPTKRVKRKCRPPYSKNVPTNKGKKKAMQRYRRFVRTFLEAIGVSTQRGVGDRLDNGTRVKIETHREAWETKIKTYVVDRFSKAGRDLHAFPDWSKVDIGDMDTTYDEIDASARRLASAHGLVRS